MAPDAPVNDLNLCKQIKQYSSVNKVVSKSALKKFENHLWYLGSELLPLSLFSSKITSEEKGLIADAMVNCGADWTDRGIKCSVANCDELADKCLHELVGPASVPALRSFGIDITLLASNDPEIWNEIPEFQQAKQVLNSIKVVNDAAERSIALMTTFNKSITKKESELQKILQVVEDNRKRIPDIKKSP